jgi:hypothetical protein
MAGPRIYCTSRQDVHACAIPWDYAAHPGDGTDHECDCGFGWIDRRYQKSQKPQLAYLIGEDSWSFSISLDREREVGPVFRLWFGRRGIHLPLRWRPWGKV